jgi:hypothetical protein
MCMCSCCNLLWLASGKWCGVIGKYYNGGIHLRIVSKYFRYPQIYAYSRYTSDRVSCFRYVIQTRNLNVRIRPKKRACRKQTTSKLRLADYLQKIKEVLLFMDRWNKHECVWLLNKTEHPRNLSTNRSDNNIDIIHKVMVLLQEIDGTTN